MEIQQQYLSVKEAATYAGVGEITIRRAIKSGLLTAYNRSLGAGRANWGIDLDDLDAFLKRNPAKKPQIVPRSRRKESGPDWQDFFGTKV